jgi:hypothetical protein
MDLDLTFYSSTSNKLQILYPCSSILYSLLFYSTTVTIAAGLLIESDSVALYLKVPTWSEDSGVKVTCPCASESNPLNNAPARGVPVEPSVIVNTTVEPSATLTVLGWTSKKWTALKALYAHNISSFGAGSS